MLFNSISFALFLPVVFLLYWFVANRSLRMQNALLLIASYYFYSCWDWRFLFLLMFSTFLDYYTGLKMCDARTERRKKFWFWLSIIINLGFLGVFKYYNFFAENFAEAAASLGWKVSPVFIKVILPVGISFYTFHGLSYVIDIYKGRIKAERNFINYSVFVCYFPLLVAGPIERATHLLPQVKSVRNFNYSQALDGMKLILWGLFKKVVIADTCAEYANLFFNNPGDYSGSSLVIGAIFFTFQIYGDFSGYSDIASGTSKLFGIDLLRNFAYPYFSRSIAEFWRRWHISLSSWFKDYLYIPLGGSKGGNRMRVRNTMIIFLVSGFWHGANWTFIIWGALNALFIMPSILLKSNRENIEIVAKGKVFPDLRELFSMMLTFGLAVFAWIFFRAESLQDAITYISRIFSASLFEVPYLPENGMAIVIFSLLVVFLVIEWIGRERDCPLNVLLLNWKRPFRYGFYYALCMLIFWFGSKEEQFIYFQF